MIEPSSHAPRSASLPVELRVRILSERSPLDLARVAQVDRSWAAARELTRPQDLLLVPAAFRQVNGRPVTPGQAFAAWMRTLSEGDRGALRALYAFEGERDLAARLWFSRHGNDKNLMWAAVARFPNKLISAPHVLRDDRELFLAALGVDGINIRLSNEALKDKALGLLAVAQNGWALEYLHPDLQADPDLRKRALLSVQRATLEANARGKEGASTKLLHDAEFMAALRRL